ncbi:hypothetical protein [Pseudoroseicyclus aestuarii]|uniref:MSHA biogenesis protein MshK n=1 Tax=Pseudoroseicyclus aestuarii TaxID=1795041 RepID=A0A318SSH4_9RHOB|nr:hypothetical protein [Pseudoroseicyclus aestuarii]PYE84780.1 hypothetical protein DFP88_102583 [Pseudoroseicyclus aestuarii]
MIRTARAAMAALVLTAAPATLWAQGLTPTENHIVPDPFIEEGGYFDIRSVMATAPSELLILRGEQVISRQAISAGAHHDVRVVVRGLPVTQDVTAVLVQDGEIVARRRLNIVDEDFLARIGRD